MELLQACAAEQRAAGERILRGKRTSQKARQLLDNAQTRIESSIESSGLNVLHECEQGCNSCCRSMAVDVTPLEALAVAEYLRENYEDEVLDEIRGQLATNTHPSNVPAPEARMTMRTPCALLGADGLCRVYPARPLACMGAFSFSQAACRQAARADDMAAAKIPLDEQLRHATGGTSGGLQHALVNAGLDGNLYELQSAVLCALDTPDALQRWLRGEDVFKHCICTDAHSPPRKLEVPPRAAPAGGAAA